MRRCANVAPMEVRLRSIGVVTAALFASSQAWAGDCATPYTIDQLLEDLTVVETALRESNDSGASATGAKMGQGLGCLDELLPALIAARAYRAVGAGMLAAGQEADADKWLRTSLEVDPTWEYGLQDIPEGHPLRPHFDALKAEPGTDYTPLAGRAFKEEGEFYLNGRKVTKPQARLDRFHVFQAQTATLSTEIIEGNAFPAAYLITVSEGPVADARKTKKPKEPKAPKDKTPKTAGDDKAPKEKVAKAAKPEKVKANKTKTVIVDGQEVTVNVRETPVEKYPLIIGGAAIIASSGVLYYLAGKSASDMKGIKGPFTYSYDDTGTPVAIVDGHMTSLNGNVPPENGRYNFCTGTQTPELNGCFIDPQDEVNRLRKKANQLVLASASVLAVGVGVTTWGVLVDGDMVMPTVNFRF